MMVFALAVAITAGAVLGGVYLLRVITTERKFHWFAAGLVSVAFGVGAFLLSLFTIDVIAGIGPDVVAGQVRADIALRTSFFCFALGIWLTWTQVRSMSHEASSIDQRAARESRTREEPKLGGWEASGGEGHNGGWVPRDKYDTLARLKALLDSGAIDSDEYQKEKDKILNG